MKHEIELSPPGESTIFSVLEAIGTEYLRAGRFLRLNVLTSAELSTGPTASGHSAKGRRFTVGA